MRMTLLMLGALILVYVYADSLSAQQAMQQRISINQAVDFPNDI